MGTRVYRYEIIFIPLPFTILRFRANSLSVQFPLLPSNRAIEESTPHLQSRDDDRFCNRETTAAAEVHCCPSSRQRPPSLSVSAVDTTTVCHRWKLAAYNRHLSLR
ncbi:hypothetical protein L2E82_14724 [Cichorium intybus]|uniref:Uncharacterized protein n=1 Tax=Cichorium intybus TaxID=13427 RepID=A0ACB9F1Y9_CICIN|nr:hypothetical protein L2E82_14724 [Cichorium intybus]